MLSAHRNAKYNDDAIANAVSIRSAIFNFLGRCHSFTELCGDFE